MTLTISGVEFERPVQHKSGVYAVTTKTASGTHRTLYIGESADIKTRVEGDHHKRECWNQNRVNGIYYWAYYCDKATRERVETRLIADRNPTCNG